VESGLAFYDAAAQVILVLLIVLAVEARVFGRPSTFLASVLFGAMFSVIVIGEFAALRVLQSGTATTAHDATVWTAIGLGLFLVAVLAAPGSWFGERGRR